MRRRLHWKLSRRHHAAKRWFLTNWKTACLHSFFLNHHCLTELAFYQFHLPMLQHGFPQPGLNLQLEPSEFQAAIQWWLGVGISGSQGATCPHCPAHSLDPLGHHALTCKHGGDVVIRHNSLRDAFAESCRRACIFTYYYK